MEVKLVTQPMSVEEQRTYRGSTASLRTTCASNSRQRKFAGVDVMARCEGLPKHYKDRVSRWGAGVGFRPNTSTMGPTWTLSFVKTSLTAQLSGAPTGDLTPTRWPFCAPSANPLRANATSPRPRLSVLSPCWVSTVTLGSSLLPCSCSVSIGSAVSAPWYLCLWSPACPAFC